MVEGVVTKGLKNLGEVFGEFYEANKPHIFTGLGIGGTILTGLLAAQSGARGARKIDRREAELGRRLTFIEKGQLCWTNAIAPVVVGGLTCYCDFKANRVFTQELSKRTMMLLASEKAYEKLSEKTREVLGEKKAKQIQEEVVKDKVEGAIQTGVLSMDDFEKAPRVGSGRLNMFVDEYTMLPFWSNADYVARQAAEMRVLMSDLAPRDVDNDYSGKKVGVPYSEWLHRIGYVGRIAKTPERKDRGWNKGYAKDGSQDDVIDYTLVPMAWEEGVSVTAVSWTENPTDMTMGRLIKSSGLA